MMSFTNVMDIFLQVEQIAQLMSWKSFQLDCFVFKEFDHSKNEVQYLIHIKKGINDGIVKKKIMVWNL